MIRNSSQGQAALLFLAVFLLGVAVTNGFAQASPPAPVSGTIVSISGANVTLALADKTQKTIVLQASTLIMERDPAELNQIRTGEALAVTSHRSGADLIATNINIFSKETWKVVRKGQWPMSTGDMMTNAMVTEYVQGMNGHTLTMKYPDGTSTITVPDGIPMHLLVSKTPTALAAGMQIVVRGTASSDGTLQAAFISFDGPVKS
jgi:acyl-CoA reductase-like NAD-dependent aldehyde dehydrogenase